MFRFIGRDTSSKEALNTKLQNLETPLEHILDEEEVALNVNLLSSAEA